MNIKMRLFKGIPLLIIGMFFILILLVDVGMLLQNIKTIIPEHILNNLKLLKKVVLNFSFVFPNIV